jgi:hypothetical protein
VSEADGARVRELVELVRQNWREHWRLARLCQVSAEETQRLQAASTDALKAARDAETALSVLMQEKALAEFPGRGA